MSSDFLDEEDYDEQSDHDEWRDDDYRVRYYDWIMEQRRPF